MGIEVDEDLSWINHIQVISRKINSALYGLAKTGRNLDPKNKKLMYSGLVHSHLVYGLPIWGFAKSGKLNALKIKQKRQSERSSTSSTGTIPIATLRTPIF